MIATHTTLFAVLRRSLLGGTGALMLAITATAQDPGSVYREHVWKPSGPLKWERVTGTDATDPGALAFLPNPVHQISIIDLTDAVACEVVIEKLTSHSGTRKPRMRVNGNAWISIPEPDPNVIPGTRGSGLPTTEYLQMTYPAIPVPLAQLVSGTNTFEFNCEGNGGSAIGVTWPQWLHYGVNFRIYYKSTKAGAPSGSILSPRDGDIVGDDPIFDVQTAPASGTSITRVDLLGDYDDFDWAGDGTESGWRASYRYGNLEHNMATLFNAPWKPRWQNTWIPTQNSHFRVVARIVASNGLMVVTEPVRLGMLRNKTVHRYRSTNISRTWMTRASISRGNDIHVTGDLSKAIEARFTVATWNATALDEVRLNNLNLMGAFGRGYDMSHDTFGVPLARINPGYNRFTTHAATLEHGCEVQWPGFELFVRYDIPETPAVFIPYGTSCVGTNGTPELSNQGFPKLTQSYFAKLSNGTANAPVILLNGFSKDTWASFPLPFDWAPIGAPGCKLATSIDFTLGLATDASGMTSQQFTVPNRPEFLGGSLFAQFAIFDPSANSLGITLSDAGRWLFGQ
ncbi:MAG: hypothetical protein KDC95_11615 [Planctomycetes bacterium]|nr:hypothetical protein [Planctomycetota bacterium]